MSDYFLHAGCTNTSGKDGNGFWSNREFPNCSGCNRPFKASRSLRNLNLDPNASPPPPKSGSAPQVAKQTGSAVPSELAVKVAVLLGHVGELPNATPMTPSEGTPLPMNQPGTTPPNISTEPSGLPAVDGEDVQGADIDEALGEQIATVCEEIEATFDGINAAIAKLETAEAATADFSEQLDALKAEMKAAEENQTTDYRTALEIFRSISQRALSARTAADRAASSALTEKQSKEEKAAREALSKKVETAIDKIFDEMLVAQRFSLNTEDIDKRRPAMRNARRDATSESNKMTHGERIASLGNTLKDAEAAVTELRRQVEEAKAAEAEREALSKKVETAIGQIYDETLAAISVSLNTQSFSDKRISLQAARSRALDSSNGMTHQERVASLDDTRNKAEEAAAELRRQVEEAKAAKAEREALSKKVETAIGQMFDEILAAIPLSLNTQSFSDQRASLQAARSSAMDSSNGMTHQNRMASLDDTRKKAEDAAAELKGLVAAAKPAEVTVTELGSLIEQFDRQYPGASIGKFIAKHTDLVARRDALKNVSVPKDLLAGLEGIAKEAGEALTAAQAALKEQPAAAEIRARVDVPLKAARSNLAMLKGPGGVDTNDIEILVRDIEVDLLEASELTDQNAAIAAAEKIAAKVGEVQKKLDAEKAKGEVAKSVEEETQEALKDLKYAVTKLTELDLAGSTIGKIEADLQRDLETAAKLDDIKARFEALARIKQAADEALERADLLASAAKGATGDATPPEKPEVYKKALESLYGLKIEIPANFTNTHLDKVFDMFAMLPMEFVAHGRLQKLKYDPVEKEAGAYAKASARVTMNDYPDPEVEDSYTVDGKVVKVNSFNVTTLHEIGHSVDALHGVMAAAMGGSGNGGWKAHGVDEIVPIFVDELKKKIVGMAIQPADAVLSQAVGAALKSGKVDKPGEVDDPDWTIMRKFLEENCLTIRADKKPWNGEPEKLKVADRVYQESYPDKWVSYEAGSRVSSLVSKYQWRAPGEWFSELFAITWLKKTKPPSGVSGAVLKYLWPPEGTA